MFGHQFSTSPGLHDLWLAEPRDMEEPWIQKDNYKLLMDFWLFRGLPPQHLCSSRVNCTGFNITHGFRCLQGSWKVSHMNKEGLFYQEFPNRGRGNTAGQQTAESGFKHRPIPSLTSVLGKWIRQRSLFMSPDTNPIPSSAPLCPCCLAFTRFRRVYLGCPI